MIFPRKPVFLVLVVALLLLAADLSLRAASKIQASQSMDQTDATKPAKKKTSGDASTDSKSTASKKSDTPAQPADASAKPAAPATTQPSPPAKSSAMVWVNTGSGVYHKPGSRCYGKTKQGKYMSEAERHQGQLSRLGQELSVSRSICFAFTSVSRRRLHVGRRPAKPAIAAGAFRGTGTLACAPFF